MSRKDNISGVRLVGPLVRCGNGGSVVIPWEFITGPSTRMRTSEAARLLHPGAPERLVGVRGVGIATIHKLRTRALVRQLRTGSNTRTWNAVVLLNGFQNAGFIALVTLGLIAAGFGLFPFLPPDHPPGARAQVEGFPGAVALAAAALGAIGALYAALVEWFDRRPTVLAFRTRPEGIDWLLDSGREVFQRWADVRGRWSRQAIWPTPPKGLRYSGHVIESDEFSFLRAAADSLGMGSYARVSRERPRIVRRSDIQRSIRSFATLIAVFGALIAVNFVVDSYRVDDEDSLRPRLPPGIAATILSVMLLGITVGYGLLVTHLWGVRNVVRALRRIG